MNYLIQSSLLAAAVAGLVTSSANAEEKKKNAKAAEEASAKKVHCFGINSCKGKSECAIDGAHGCSGANDCKGKGWITVTLKECNNKKGKVVN